MDHLTASPDGTALAGPASSISAGPAPAIALRDLHKHFGAVRAVDGIDLTIEPGEIVAFLGPNGAGKTTTIDMVLGLSQPTQGSVEVLRDGRRGRPSRRGWSRR